jgi:hypothetical protein
LRQNQPHPHGFSRLTTDVIVTTTSNEAMDRLFLRVGAMQN